MARGNKYKCASCGTKFEYCPSCDVKTPSYDAERFCCRKHAEIFEILSKNGCHLATAEETLATLKDYDTTGLTKSIQAHIKSLQPKTEVKKEVETNAKKYSVKTQE